MYREYACYDCRMLSHCDQHWDETTKEWDYPDLRDFPKHKKEL
jgi:hypothetical protein